MSRFARRLDQRAWLAAVGATVLDARVRLQWTTDGVPLEVLSAAEVDPVAALVESWPDAALLSGLPIARSWKGAGDIQRKVPVEAFVERARAARGHPYCWTLSSTMTDLCVDEHGEVVHAPFDPAGPGTVKWLHHRLMKVHKHVEPAAGRIRDSLAGRAVRVKDNGLGSDQTRLGSQTDNTRTRPGTDPRPARTPPASAGSRSAPRRPRETLYRTRFLGHKFGLRGLA